MSYFEYVVAAYAVFAVVLAWDFVAPKLQLRQQLRAARLRVAREAAAKHKDTGSPLARSAARPGLGDGRDDEQEQAP